MYYYTVHVLLYSACIIITNCIPVQRFNAIPTLDINYIIMAMTTWWFGEVSNQFAVVKYLVEKANCDISEFNVYNLLTINTCMQMQLMIKAGHPLT